MSHVARQERIHAAAKDVFHLASAGAGAAGQAANRLARVIEIDKGKAEVLLHTGRQLPGRHRLRKLCHKADTVAAIFLPARSPVLRDEDIILLIRDGLHGTEIPKPQLPADEVAHAAGTAVKVGMHGIHRDVVPDQGKQLPAERCFVVYLLHGTKKDRMMGQNELRTGFNGRVDDLLRGIQCHIYLRDLPVASSHEKPRIVPVTGSLSGR